MIEDEPELTDDIERADTYKETIFSALIKVLVAEALWPDLDRFFFVKASTIVVALASYM